MKRTGIYFDPLLSAGKKLVEQGPMVEDETVIGESQDVKIAPVADSPAGTGLPPLEMFLQRNLIFPLICRLTSFEGALALFEKESHSLIMHVSRLAPLARERRILVPRLPAIEDCSRFWSAAMVLEHLIISGSSIKNVVQHLAEGRQPAGAASIAAVKPRGELAGEACVDSFIEFNSQFLNAMHAVRSVKQTRASFSHPWFGQLTLKQWVCLAAIHQRIHRRQVEAIISRL